jgi:phosphoserine phosphatase
VAVGDGPTDLPLLRWAGVAVVVAHDGAGFARLAARRVQGCAVVGSISQLPEVIRRHGG